MRLHPLRYIRYKIFVKRNPKRYLMDDANPHFRETSNEMIRQMNRDFLREMLDKAIAMERSNQEARHEH